VRFTVDAFPDETFEGEVAQIRLNATMTQNVVTYTVVVNTDNSGGRLLPYLTTNLRFESGRRSDVLLVPNGALRWRPKPNYVVPEFRDQLAAATRTPACQASAETPPATGAGERPRKGTVWVAAGQSVRPVEIQLGLSDGTATEVTAGDLKQGDQLVVGEVRVDVADSASNPFTPQMFGSRKAP
jgi:HlyD family secretion protein